MDYAHSTEPRAAAQEDLRRRAWLHAGAWFAVLVAAALIGFAPSLRTMITTWANSTTYTHGFVVLPITLFLLWRRREALPHEPPRQAPGALLAVAGAALLWLLGRAAEAALVEQVALVSLLIALFVFCFGYRIGRLALFPLAFLFFMVPFGDFLIPPLQDLTAWFAVHLLRLVGVPVYQDKILIYVPNGLFVVAEACAGLRFLIANVMVGALFAYSAYTSTRKRVLFMLLVLLVPLLANGLRAFGIVYLGYLTDNSIAVGADHLVYGWGFFTAVMLLLLFLGSLFADRQPDGQTAAARSAPGREPVSASGWRTWLGVLALLLVAGIPAYAWATMRPPPPLTAEAELPPVAEGWTRSAETPADWQPHFIGTDRTVFERYEGAEGPVEWFVAFYRYQRHGAEAINQMNRFADDDAWHRVEAGQMALGAAQLPDSVRFQRLRSPAGERLVAFWYWTYERFSADPLTANLWQTMGELTGSGRAGAVLAISTPVEDDPAEAKARIIAFAKTLRPLDGYLARLAGHEGEGG